MEIAIVDDHKLIPELLKQSLSEFDFVNNVSIYDSPQDFVLNLQSQHVDILITDMLMPDMNGIELIAASRKLKNKKELRILVLSTVIDSNTIRDAFKNGANGYLTKDASKEELVKAIKSVYEDENKTYIGETIKDILIHSHLFESVTFNLLPREKELIRLVCDGKTVKETASHLGLSVNTVQSYMKQLMRKLDVNRTPDLILKAIKYGLYHPTYIIN